MAYDPGTDFLGLLRQESGVELERMPGLDYVVAALSRTGLINLYVGQTAPVSNQTTTAWFKPAVPSWTAEGQLFLWDASVGDYVLATPALWTALFTVTSAAAPGAPSTTVTHAMSPYTPSSDDTYLAVDATDGPVEITLASSFSRTSVLIVKDDKGMAPVNNITIRPYTGQTADNYTNLSPLILVSAYDGARLRPRTTSGYSIEP